MKTLTWLISLIAFAALLTENAAAQCTRHFYNNSNSPFAVGFVGGGTCNGSPVCEVRPHTTSTLVYLPLPGGAVAIVSSFYRGNFGVTGCYIIHSGGTGAIAVNDPADGDVTTCGNPGWECPPALRGHRKKRLK
jgi:hypothetical protein